MLMIINNHLYWYQLFVLTLTNKIQLGSIQKKYSNLELLFLYDYIILIKS